VKSTARDTLRYLQRNSVVFIKPDMWPPNSPDLNSVDYTVWGTLQQLVYKHRSLTSIAELKQAIVNAWQQLSQGFIDKSVNEWRRRLEGVVQQNGGHIEYLLK